MSLPLPEPGLVISYAYLWRHEHDRGQDEGRKNRTCLIVLAVYKPKGKAVPVTVAAITHTPPNLHQAARATLLEANAKRKVTVIQRN